MRIALFFVLMLSGCSFSGGAKSDHKPLTAIVDSGVSQRCHVTSVRLVNGVVHLEC